MRRRRIFIGSSVEARPCARVLHRYLKAQLGNQYQIVPWYTKEIWKNLESILDNLDDAVREFDYAIFLSWPDDIVESPLRSETTYRTRDNVVFEFGMFLSLLGRKRTFILAPNVRGGKHKFKVMSDIGDSIITHRYSGSISKTTHKFVPTTVSVRSVAQQVASQIKRDVKENSNLSEHVGSARTKLEELIGDYRSKLDDFARKNASDHVRLALSRQYIAEMLAKKAIITGREVADACEDLAIYFELVEDILNISQLAEKQRADGDNEIDEVWVFSDSPLEFLHNPKSDVAIQVSKLKETIVKNIKSGVSYKYFVASEQAANKIIDFVREHRFSRNARKKIEIVRLDNKAFKTYFTIHKYNGDHQDIYMSAMTHGRNDLLIKVSNEHAERIHERMQRIIGQCADGGLVKVINFT